MRKICDRATEIVVPDKYINNESHSIVPKVGPMHDCNVPNSNTSRDSFVRHLTESQSRLFGYIMSLVADVNDANNVLQQTNLVLWENANQFVEGTTFHAWAIKTAYFQTLAYLRDKQRDRLVFDEELVHQLAARPVEMNENELQQALRHCLGRLSDDQLDLLRQRYWPGKPIGDIASHRRRSISAIKSELLRLRRALARCIENQMKVYHGP